MGNADSIVFQNNMHKIIKLNPFDSVVALKWDKEQFEIVMINEQARQLKSEQLLENLPVEKLVAQYFH